MPTSPKLRPETAKGYSFPWNVRTPSLQLVPAPKATDLTVIETVPDGGFSSGLSDLGSFSTQASKLVSLPSWTCQPRFSNSFRARELNVPVTHNCFFFGPVSSMTLFGGRDKPANGFRPDQVVERSAKHQRSICSAAGRQLTQ